MNIIHRDFADSVPLRLLREAIEATSIAVHYADGRVEQLPGLKITRVEEAGEAKPAKVAKAAQPARKRVLPADSDYTSGLVVAMDARVQLAPTERLVWLYLLRHAGKDERRHLRLAYSVIGEGLGLSRQRIKRAMPRLVELGLVVVREKGRMSSRGAAQQTPLYYVPFPTSKRIDAWESGSLVTR
jgi:DNA-binding transcriptional ArsR family regulator